MDPGIAKFLPGGVVSLTPGHHSLLIKFPVWIGPLVCIEHQCIGRFFHLALSLGQGGDHGGKGASLVVARPTRPGEGPAHIAAGLGLLGGAEMVDGIINGVEIKRLGLGV